jgi:predicted phage terminase large subunit-like protein
MDGTTSAIITPAQAAQELQRRRKARTSLYEFLKQAWPHFEGGRQLTEGWAIGAIAEHLQAVLDGEIRDLLINQPPRTTKSSLTAVCLVPFDWISHPNTQFFYTSYSDKLSIRDHVKARRLIESSWYQTRWGNVFQLTDDQNTKIRYDNTMGGYRVASSTDGTVTGDGGDILVCDDPNSAKDLSDTVLESVRQWWRDVMPTRLNDFKTGRRIVVQQRVHEKDISGEIMANDTDGSWAKLILPMEFEEKRRCITVKLPSTKGKKWSDPRAKEGELLWPERIGVTELRKLKKELGQYAIAGQLQQRPAPSSGGIIKKDWFKIWRQPTPPRLNFIMLSVDTAMSKPDDQESKRDDYKIAYSSATCWGVFDHPETRIPCALLLSRWRERVEYPELRKRIARLANHYLDLGPLDAAPLPPNRKYKPDLILIERKNNGISLIQDLGRGGLTITGFNPDKLGDKTNRVRLITPLIESGRVWLPGLPPLYTTLRRYAEEFLESAIGFPKLAARDDVDTMTQALYRLQQSGWIHVGGDPMPVLYTGHDYVETSEPIY